MFYFIIVCIVVILILILIEYRYHLQYFWNLLDVTNKNNKNLKELQNQGTKQRNLTDDVVKKYKDTSYSYLKKINKTEFKKYILNKDLESKLRYSKFSEDNVKTLFYDIGNHIGIDYKNIELEIIYKTGKFLEPYAGLYVDNHENEKLSKIQIIITSDTTIEELVSVIAHESTHHLLMSKDIRLKDRIANECLTDVTTVILGFGKYMIKGYQISNQVLYEKENFRTVKKNRIGYLSSSDIKYLMKII